MVMNLQQTTSPSYPSWLHFMLHASRWRFTAHSFSINHKTMPAARNREHGRSGICCAEIEGSEGCFTYDETKFAINVRELGLSGFEMEKLLKYKYGIQVELSDLYNVLGIGAIGDDESSINALVAAVKDIALNHSRRNVVKISCDMPDTQKLEVFPRFAFYSEKGGILKKTRDQ